MTTLTRTSKLGGYHDFDNGLLSTSHSYLTLTVTKTRTGVPNPNWRQQVASAQNASTAFTGSESWCKYTDGRIEVKRWHPSIVSPTRRLITMSANGVYRSYWSIPSNANLSLLESDNLALKRVYKAIREESYQISGPTFLGELRESLKMLKRPAAGLRDYANRYLRDLKYAEVQSRLYRAKRSVRTVKNFRVGTGDTSGPGRALAEIWLEYSFGWSPFLSDIKAAAETVARLSIDIRRSRVKGYGETSSVPTHFYSNDISGSDIRYISQELTISKAITIYRVGLDAALNKPPVGAMDKVIELSGFQMQNFVPTAWELLPWSFMIDYFTNIGDVIEGSYTDQSKVTHVTKTTIQETRKVGTKVYDVAAMLNTYGSSVVWRVGDSLGSLNAYNRLVIRVKSALGYPTLTFELPIRTGQLGNIAALFVSGRRMQPYRA